jgi:2,3-bisphosphoglycerate-independent phosphoglycerate mutase
LCPPAPPSKRPAQAAHTAAVVNELSSEMRRVLADHPINARRAAEGANPANVVLLRGCGCRIKARSRAGAWAMGRWASSTRPAAMDRLTPHLLSYPPEQVPTFDELHGMRACLVAPTKIIAGAQSGRRRPGDWLGASLAGTRRVAVAPRPPN